MNSDVDIEILEKKKSQSTADWKSLLLQMMFWTWKAEFIKGKLVHVRGESFQRTNVGRIWTVLFFSWKWSPRPW